MKLKIQYDINKDIENFMKGQKAVNRPSSTEVERVYNDRFGEFNVGNLSRFIDEYTQEENYDMPVVIDRFTQEWEKTEEEFERRSSTLFEIVYPLESITAYITINNRCTYSIEGGFFFLSVRAKSVGASIMHELFHFFTHAMYTDQLQKLKLAPSRYNEIKESLTVLLNTEFKDLMGEAVDKGYPQHKDMRAKILNLRESGCSIVEIFTALAKN